MEDDILNIIGDYVKNDNLEKERMEKFKQDVFEFVDRYMKRARKDTKLSRDETRETIWLAFDEIFTFRFGPRYHNDKFVELTKLVNTQGRESGGSWFETCSGVWYPRRRPCGVAINTLVDLNKLAGETPSLNFTMNI